MNPELQRYLWLELSPHRLLATPLVLAVVFGFLHLVLGWDAGHTFATSGWMIAAAIGVLWGTRSAGDAVVGEVRDGTWDQQRLSSQRPWSLTWAKLLGAPVFAWYATVPCLAMLVVGATARMPLAAALGHALVLSVILVFAHAVSLLTSLFLAAGGGAGLGRAAAGLNFIGLVSALPMLSLALDGFADGWNDTVVWFATPIPSAVFIVASIAGFTLWAIAACYRLMRAELKLRNAPWVWLAFSLFLMAYLAGFSWGGGTPDPTLRVPWPVFAGAAAVTAHTTALALGYFSLFTQPKDLVDLRRLLSSLRAGTIGNALEVLPRWTWTVPLAGITVAWAASTGAGAAFGVSSLLFFARDAGLVMLLNLSPRRGRADLAALIYLLLLYGLVPTMIEVATGASPGGWLWPAVNGSMLLAVVPPALQAAAVWLLAGLRWQRGWREPLNPVPEGTR